MSERDERGVGREKNDKILLGLCIRDKKMKTSHNKNIMARIEAFGDISIVSFGDNLILNESIDKWPLCDVLICYYSDGFPFDKALNYISKYKPCEINNAESEKVLRNRLLIKETLIKNNIATPRYAVIDRSNNNSNEYKIIEYDNKIIINDITINKPFVEKPINAEDHNIYVYLKNGGSRRLFRKIGNKSSVLNDKMSCIRRNGSYIYEEMIESGNDIKCYSVGLNYVHAETRKSPTVDGIVERDLFDKEIRHICRLTKNEKNISNSIVKAFKQNVCGFDILRSNKDGQSYVIDVNNWSFAKNHRRYYDACARRIRAMCLDFDRRILRPTRYIINSNLINKYKVLKYSNAIIDRQKMHILRGVFAVFRHGDRTPKQKYKCSTHEECVIKIISNNKKQQIKWNYKKNSKDISNFAKIAQTLYQQTGKDKWLRISQIASMKMESIKLQIKAADWNVGNGNITLALCIIKWGGVLTPAGYHQCSEFAPRFRDMVLKTNLNRQLQYNFLKNMETYHSEEVRVRNTAKSFVNSLFTDLTHLMNDNDNENDSKNENESKKNENDGQTTMESLIENDQLTNINVNVLNICKEGKYVQKMLDDISDAKSLIEFSKFEIQKIFYNRERREYLTQNFDDFNNEKLKKRKIKQQKEKEKNAKELAQREKLMILSDNTNNNNNNNNNNNDISIDTPKSTSETPQTGKESDEIIYFDENDMNGIINNEKSSKSSNNENMENDKLETSSVGTFSDSMLHKSDIDLSFMRYNFSGISVKHGTNSTNINNNNNSNNNTLTVDDGSIATSMKNNEGSVFEEKEEREMDAKKEVSNLLSDDHESLLPWTQRSLFLLQDPIEKCGKLFEYIVLMRDCLLSLSMKQKELKQKAKNENENELDSIIRNVTPYLDESLDVMIQRWNKIIEELYDSENDKFDCSKIPDVFDSCRYDLLHNRHLFCCFDEHLCKTQNVINSNNNDDNNCDIDIDDNGNDNGNDNDNSELELDIDSPFFDRKKELISSQCMNFLRDIWHYTELLSAFVIPQEYGFTKRMKKSISNKICRNLFLDIKNNILNHCINDVLKKDESISFEKRCFLYFTSESYLHSLRNALILSDIPHNKFVLADIEGMECSYFSHGVIRVFEDIGYDKNDKNDNNNGSMNDELDAFYVEIQFSPGAHANPLVETDEKDVIPVVPCGPLCGRYPLKDFLTFLEKKQLQNSTDTINDILSVSNVTV